MRLIVCFKKSDNAKYISHLDLQRTVDRALRRSGVDVLYSAGFNPHIQMSFAFALKVGLTSKNEYLEVSVDENIDIIDAEKRIKDSFPKGLEVNWVRKKKENTKKLMASVAMARYDVLFNKPFDTEKIESSIQEIMDFKELEIEKKTKKGLRTFDARPLIYKIAFDKDQGKIDVLLAAQQPDTLPPNLLINKILLVAEQKNRYTISRTNLYTIIEKKVHPLSFLAE